MNRFISGVPVVLVFCAVAGAAADEVPSTAAPVAATTAASGTTPASEPGHPTVNRLVCLNMTLQCFSTKQSADSKQRPLDLKAPDIRRVAPAILLHAPDEPIDIEEQQVEVQGTRPEVYVPGGIASLPWALMHPTQAWRIFLPVPPGTAK